MTEMDGMTQQNAAMVQQTSSAASGMRQHAAKLNELINSFVLGEASNRTGQALPQQRIGSNGGAPALSDASSEWQAF